MPVRLPTRLEDRIALGVLVLALGWLAVPLLDGSRQIAARDAGRMYAPMKHLIGEELRSGHLTTWNPLIGLGEPVVSGVNSGPLDPLNLLLVLPFSFAFKLLHFACYLAAAIGTLLWLRQRRFSMTAAVLGAWVFCASGYLTGIANNFAYLRGLAFIPLFFAAFEWALDSATIPRVVLAGLAWAGILLGGEPQTWLLALPAALLMSGDHPIAPPFKARLLRALDIAGFGAAFAAPIILPVVFAFPDTDRGSMGAAGVASQWWFVPARLAELFVPYLLDTADPGSNPVYAAHFAAGRAAPWVPSEYLGALGLVLAGFGLRNGRGRHALVLGVVALWLAMGPVLGAEQVGRWIPVWKSFQFPEKLLGWVALAATVLAAHGLDYVCADPRWTRRFALATIIGAIVAAAGATFAWSCGEDLLWTNARHGLSQVVLLLLGAALLALTFKRRREALGIGLLVLVAADLGLANSLRPALLPKEAVEAGTSPIVDWLREHDALARVSTPFEHAAGASPTMDEQFRLWSRTLVPLWNVEAGIGNMGWYGGLAQARYRVLRETGAPGFRYLEAAAAHGAAYLVVPGPLENLKLVGIDPQQAEALATDPRVPATLVRVAHRPFAYVAREVARVDATTALQTVLEPGFAVSGRTVVEAKSVFRGYGGESHVEAKCPSPTRCEVEVRAAGEATLVVNVPLLPGWTFEVDGKEVDAVQANFLASAIALPHGPHHVRLSYREPGLIEGLGFAAAAVAAGVLLTVRSRRRRPG